MKRTFILAKEFSRSWDELGFTDKDLHRLKNDILKNPEVGAIMKGTGGLRKMRFAYEGRGKSGSVRVGYVDFKVKETIHLITVFAKADQENLTNAEKHCIKTMISNLKKELSKESD